jgi:hypothetical protein
MASWTVGALAMAGAAGCFASNDEAVDSSPDHVIAGGDTSAVLKSTLVLRSGCTATKIGPKHLLIAARCVAGNDAFAAGKTLEYTAATVAKSTVAPASAKDGGSDADASDAGDAGAGESDEGDDAGEADGGASGSSEGEGASESSDSTDSSEPAPTSHTATIADVRIHPSFEAKCKKASDCALGALGASNAPDIAVILLEDDLDTVPTVPVDLDPVGEGDPLLVVSSGCARVDAEGGAEVRTTKAVAAPAKSVNHDGSPYVSAPQLVSRVASAYVVTAGAGWKKSAPKLCLGDLGAPIFRGASAAVAGVTSNFTTRGEGALVPVTIEHTRVDGTSRFKIGAWLEEMGAETIHSCSESADGCVKSKYDGGLPDDDTTTGGSADSGAPGTTGGGDADGGAPTSPDGGDADASAEPSDPSGGNVDSPLPPDDEGDYGEGDYGEGDYGEGDYGEGDYGEGDYGEGDYGEGDYPTEGAPKKKKASSGGGGCSTAPGSSPVGTGLPIGLGLAVALTIARRRRGARAA